MDIQSSGFAVAFSLLAENTEYTPDASMAGGSEMKRGLSFFFSWRNNP